MVNLIDQEALQPYFEYTPPKGIGLSKWCRYPCPICGGPKHRVSPKCRKCNILLNPDRPDEGPNTYTIGEEVCRRIPLVGKSYSLVNEFNYERLIQWPWRVLSAGVYQPTYAVTDVKMDRKEGNCRRLFKGARMHHIITSTPSGIAWDHKNRIGLDNRISNLRLCSSSQNMANRGVRRDNTSGYIGIHWSSKLLKWISRIGVDGKRINLGCFHDPREAAVARDRAATKYFGEFAVLNFPDINEEILRLVKSLTQAI